MEKTLLYKAENDDAIKLVENAGNELIFYITSKDKTTKILLKHNENKTFSIFLDNDLQIDNLLIDELTDHNEFVDKDESETRKNYDCYEIMKIKNEIHPEEFCDALDIDENGKLFIEQTIVKRSLNPVYFSLMKKLNKNEVHDFYSLLDCYLRQAMTPFNDANYKQDCRPGSGKEVISRWGPSRRIILRF